ncbi:MAG: DUF3367 domain-containing protein [Nitrososphaerota archaeon]|nr:DUF3367 domain-containing protein [Nitrososphaerota archaeon]
MPTRPSPVKCAQLEVNSEAGSALHWSIAFRNPSKTALAESRGRYFVLVSQDNPLSRTLSSVRVKKSIEIEQISPRSLNRLQIKLITSKVLSRSWHVIFTASVAAFIALNSIQAGNYVAGGDAILPEFNPGIALLHLSNTWDSSAGLGGDVSFSRALLFPFVTIDYLLAGVGASPLFMNNFWIVFILATQSLAMLWLFRVLFPRLPRILSVFSGLISIVNPYMLLTFHTPYPPTALSIAVVPAVAAALIQLRREMRPYRVLVLILLALIMATGDNNPGVPMAEFLMLLPIIIILTFKQLGIAARLRYLMVIGLSFCAANMLWVIPSLTYVSNNLNSAADKTASSSASILQITGQYSGILNSARLIGDYLFFNDVAGKPYISQSPQYARSPWLIAATWVLPAMALFGFLVSRHLGEVRPIGYITIFGLLLAKGAGSPLGEPFTFLVQHVTILQAFRDSFSKFGWVPMYGYSILASLCLYEVWRLRNKTIAVCITLVFITGPAAGGYPILAASFFTPQAVTKIPPRYFALSNWLNHITSPGRVLDLPVSPYAYDTYRWGYVGAGLLPNMVRRGFVSRMFDFSSTLTKTIDDVFQNYSTQIGTPNIHNLLSIYGIKYVIYDPSINPQYFSPSFSSEAMVSAPPGLTLVKTFGSIRVYSVNSSVNPLFFPPKSIFLSKTVLSLQGMLRLCQLQETGCLKTAFISGARGHILKGATVQAQVKDQSRSLTFQGNETVITPKEFRLMESSSTSYSIQVTGAPLKYLIVMNSTFSNEWNLTSSQKNIQITHIKANQGENAWIIDGGRSNQSLVVNYLGNRLVPSAFLASGVALLLSLVLSVILSSNSSEPTND